ncbi:MAG: hypothetical protein Q7T89_17765 [Anaerolineales bacterium]|nr:hypothetical protein [Anaerolineales bacterium]
MVQGFVTDECGYIPVLGLEKLSAHGNKPIVSRGGVVILTTLAFGNYSATVIASRRFCTSLAPPARAGVAAKQSPCR